MALRQVAARPPTLQPCAVSVRAQETAGPVAGDPSVVMGLKWGRGTVLSSFLHFPVSKRKSWCARGLQGWKLHLANRNWGTTPTLFYGHCQPMVNTLINILLGEQL